MIKFLLIALGGALGAPLRYFINDLMKNFYFFMMPSGTMLINFIGCFCIGIAMAKIPDFKSNIYFFLIIGMLGSFTTMSAFSQQTIEMLYNGKAIHALAYVLLSISSCMIGTLLAYSFFKAA